MHPVAQTYLRQARTFLRNHDPQKAVELLETARALARDDPAQLREVLEVLEDAYQQAGMPEKAARVSEQLSRLPGEPGSFSEGPIAPMSIAPPTRPQMLVKVIGAVVGAILVVALIGTLWRLHNASTSTPRSGNVPSPNVPATMPTEANPPIAPATPLTTEPSAAAQAPNIEARVRSCLALLVLVGDYEGITNGSHLKLDVPLASGAAFVIRRSGILLTAKSVTHQLKENNFPATLESLKLPTLTLRDIRYVVCFGADASNWIDAKLLFESDKFDVAVISTNHHFANSLDCSGGRPMSDEKLTAWSYASVSIAELNTPNADASHVQEVLAQLDQSHSANMLSAFLPDCFDPQSTSATVSVPERNIDGEECVQYTARNAPGDAGGPLVDASGRAIAIAHFAQQKELAGYNLAVLTNQLQDEIAPYVSGE